MKIIMNQMKIIMNQMKNYYELDEKLYEKLL